MTLHPQARLRLEAVPYRDFDYPRLVQEGPAGGRWEPNPTTFRVEEIPAYPFCGEGEHAALRVEKQGLTTREVASSVAQQLGLPPAAVGYAGMKDKAATTVQGFTVTGVPEQRAAEAFAAAGCRVLECTRHRNKLRLGHLTANRFQVLLAGTDLGRAAEVLARLSAAGVPNYYGPQRFGARGDNARAGLRVLRGEQRAKRWQRDLFTSAAQSLLFNEVLARRLEDGAFRRVLEGDVLRREDSGGLFLCQQPEEDQPRFDRWEVSPTGPMPGRKIVRPAGAAADREARVLEAFGLGEELFRACDGTRRPLRVPLEVETPEAADGGVWLRFALPAGAFATSVLREVMGISPGTEPEA